MTFQNLRPALTRLLDVLRHKALGVAQAGQRLGAIFHRLTLKARLVCRTFPLENRVEQLFRGVWAINFLNRFEHIEGESVAIGFKQLMGPASQAVNHLGPSHFLWAAPGIEITVAFQRQAMLLDAHVAHLHSRDQLVDGKSLGPFQRVKDLEPLGTANFGK